VIRRAYVLGELIPSSELTMFTSFSDSPDVRWVFIGVKFGLGTILAQEGRVDDAIAILHEELAVLEQAGGWVQNYPFFLFQAGEILWWLNRTDGLEILERNLRVKVVEPDVRYPDVDGRWMLGRLCALDGRIDEAREWFADARRVLTEQETGVLIIGVDYDEALMLARIGNPEDRAGARALLDRARARCSHPALVHWLQRIDALAATLQ
jgi:hypothetical protein